jgi:hypothetical protein
VTSWLGNTPSIALKHYLMMRDPDFEKALEGSLEKTMQKTTQPAHAKDGMARHASQAKNDLDQAANEKAPEKRGFASGCDEMPSRSDSDGMSKNYPTRIRT